MSCSLKWRVENFGSYVEVTPESDSKAHLAADECWCNPQTDYTDGSPLISHNVYDNCKSYNGDFGKLPEVILKAPNWSSKETICVDNCINDVIEHLWSNGIVTLGSCCGHGKVSPDIVLGENETDCSRVYKLIEEKDSRSWTLKQWQLVDISLQSNNRSKEK